MDDTQKPQQPISDDQELAKVLAGVNQQADEVTELDLPDLPATDGDSSSTPPPFPPADTSFPGSGATGGGNVNLEAIKKDALQELRPLIDKLDVGPEEKFDTYLLLIRSTDDSDLIAPAHDAALLITDEPRRAQALLDVIKEIDYLNSKQQQPAS